MRILLVGAGGVGSAFCAIAARRDFFEQIVVSDYDEARAKQAADAVRRPAVLRRAGRRDSADAVADLVRRHDITHVMNAVDPRFVMPIFNGALAGGADYLDMAMSLSRRASRAAVRTDRRQARRRAVRRRGPVGGRRPARARRHRRGARAFRRVRPLRRRPLFSDIDELGMRDGSNLTVDGYEFAPSFSIWTTIEECLNPPVIWEADRGWFTTEPFSEPEVFDFPEGIGPVECVNVEHEEVLLIPRWVEVQAGHVQVRPRRRSSSSAQDAAQARAGPHREGHRRRRRGQPARRGRRVPARSRPRSATEDARQDLRRLWVTGTGKDGKPRVDLPVPRRRQPVDDGRVRQPGVVWQTAINPVVALELLANGTWSGTACSAPRRSTPCRSSTC